MWSGWHLNSVARLQEHCEIYGAQTEDLAAL